MRIGLASLLFLLAAGCGDDGSPDIDRIEIRRSGWTAVDIALDRRGAGRFHLSEPLPAGTDGSFSVHPAQFQRLIERLEPYRKQSVPMTDESARKFVEEGCPKGLPVVTDAGAVYLRWIGPDMDRHYLAELGCDPERNGQRNRDLLALVRSLPVPLSASEVPVAILPGSAATKLLNQCTRAVPPPGEGRWAPTLADVDRLESLLPPALAAAPRAKGEDFSNLFLRWKRQYVGVVRGGRRFLYGNFLLADDDVGLLSWRVEPVIVCDGGPPFFGVEFDVEAGRITHLAFNGSL